MPADAAPAAPAMREAYVTLVTTDAYVVGALVLGHSLRESGTNRPMICMVTPGLAADSLDALAELFHLRHVPLIDSLDAKRLHVLGRPELGCTLTKINVWTLLDVERVVFLDADIVVLANIDGLFERDELSAAPDVGWPDCFNSGLFVCRPSRHTFDALAALAREEGSFDGGDQGLLNAYFSSWSLGPAHKRIPFVYNLTFSASYSYLPAFHHFHKDVKCVHFIGARKPWTFNRFSDGKVAPRGDASTTHIDYIQAWWDIHDRYIKPKGLSSCPPSFMNLYAGSGYGAAHVGAPAAIASDAHGEASSAPCLGGPSMDASCSADFANYRIKWTSDVESFFQRKKGSAALAAQGAPSHSLSTSRGPHHQREAAGEGSQMRQRRETFLDRNGAPASMALAGSEEDEDDDNDDDDDCISDDGGHYIDGRRPAALFIKRLVPVDGEARPASGRSDAPTQAKANGH